MSATEVEPPPKVAWFFSTRRPSPACENGTITHHEKPSLNTSSLSKSWFYDRTLERGGMPATLHPPSPELPMTHTAEQIATMKRQELQSVTCQVLGKDASKWILSATNAELRGPFRLASRQLDSPTVTAAT